MEIRATLTTEGDSAKVKQIIDYINTLTGVVLESIEAR